MIVFYDIFECSFLHKLLKLGHLQANLHGTRLFAIFSQTKEHSGLWQRLRVGVYLPTDTPQVRY